MPAYAPSSALLGVSGIGSVLFNAEAITAPESSIPVLLPSNKSGMPKSFSVELQFSADPGAFNIVVQTADTDADASYVNNGTAITSGLNASFAGRVELTNIVAKYARIQVVSITNSVNVTATVFNS